MRMVCCLKLLKVIESFQKYTLLENLILAHYLAWLNATGGAKQKVLFVGPSYSSRAT